MASASNLGPHLLLIKSSLAPAHHARMRHAAHQSREKSAIMKGKNGRQGGNWRECDMAGLIKLRVPHWEQIVEEALGPVSRDSTHTASPVESPVSLASVSSCYDSPGLSDAQAL
jgi:hypothetical protein